MNVGFLYGGGLDFGLVVIGVLFAGAVISTLITKYGDSDNE